MIESGERADDAAVELRSRTAFDLGYRLLERSGLLVGPSVGQTVKDVGDGGDAAG